MKKLIPCFLVLALLSWMTPVSAQPFTLDPRIKPVELKLTDYRPKGESKPNGRMGHKVFTQTKDTAYYFVKGLSMYSPTYVSLNSTSPDADIEVKLCQENWRSFHREAKVAGQEFWSANFKTEGDFGIMVIARHLPVRYVLLGWTGKELKMELPSVFKAPGAATNSESPGWIRKNGVMVAIIISALAIIGFLIYKLKQKKS